MAFGAKVKLSVNNDNKSELRQQIQRAVDDASGSRGIRIRQLKLEDGAAKLIAGQVQAALNESKFTVSIKSIDVSKPIQVLKRDLESMLSGLKITGLKDFLGSDITSKSLADASRETERLAIAEAEAQHSAAIMNASVKEVAVLQKQIASLETSTFTMEDIALANQYRSTLRGVANDLEQIKHAKPDEQGDLLNKASSTIAFYKQEIELQKQRRQAAQEAEREQLNMLAGSRDALAKISSGLKNVANTDQLGVFRGYVAEISSMLDSIAGKPVADWGDDLTSAQSLTKLLEDQIVAQLDLERAARAKADAENAAANAAKKAADAQEKSNATSYEKQYKSALSHVEKIGTALKSIGNEEALTSFRKELHEIDTFLKDTKDKPFVIQQEEIDIAQQMLDALRRQVDLQRDAEKIAKDRAAAEKRAATEAKKAANEAAKNNVNLKAARQIQSQIDKDYQLSFGLKDAEARAAVQQAYEEISTELQKIMKLEGEQQRNAIAGATELAAALNRTVDGYIKLEKAAEKASAQSAISKTYSDMNSYAIQNTRVAETFKEEFDEWFGLFRNKPEEAAEKLGEIERAFENIKKAANESGLTGKTFFQQFESGFNKLIGLVGMARVMSAVKTAVREVTDNVLSLDAAMTELRKVTDLTTDTYERYKLQAGNIAKDIGASVSETINATADFSRLGFDLQDASELAEAALIYKNIGDGIKSIDEASASIISTMKAYRVEAEDAMHIVDAFNEVGNNFAITSAGIGEALTRSASALAAAGNTLEESIGMVTAANEIIQNPDSVGTAMKTLSMYLRASKTDAEEAGISTDGMANSVSELRSELMRLTDYTSKPVDIMINDSEFKSTYDILRDVAEVWDEIQDVDRANMLELMGGKRNANTLTALITNFEKAEEAMKTAGESTGSAWAENEKYLDSINGKIKDLKASIEALSGELVHSGITKTFISIATSLVDLLSFMQEFGLLLPSIGAAYVTLTSILGTGKVQNIAQQFSALHLAGVDTDKIMLKLCGTLTKLTSVEKALLKEELNRLVADGKLSNEIKEQIVNNISLTASNTGAAFSFKALAASIKTTIASMNMLQKASLILTAFFGVIQLVTGIINKVKTNQEKAAESVKELVGEYNDATEEISKNIDTLEGLRDEFDELSKGVDANGENIDLTSDEYDRYLSIVRQIVDISPTIVQGYDNEAQAIQSYASAIDEAIQAQEELARNERDKLIAKGPETLKISAQSYQSAYNDAFSDMYELMFGFEEIAIRAGMTAEDLNAAFESIGIQANLEMGDDPMSMYSKLSDYMVEIYNSRDEFVQYLSELRDENGELLLDDDEVEGIDRLIGTLTDDIEKLDAATENVKAYYEAWLIEYNESFKDLPKIALPGLYDIIVQGVADNSRDKDIQDQLTSYVDTWADMMSQPIISVFHTAAAKVSKGEMSSDEYTDMINDAFMPVEDTLEKASKELAAGEITEKEYKERLERIAAYSEALADIPDDYSTVMWNYFMGFISGIKSTDDAIGQTQSELGMLADSLSSLTEGYELLRKAQDEMRDGGGLSADTIDSILDTLDDNESASDYLYEENGLIKLNTELWQKRSEAAMTGDISALRAEKERLEQEITSKQNEINEREKFAVEHSGTAEAVIATQEAETAKDALAELEEQYAATGEEIKLYNAILAEGRHSQDPLDLSSMLSDLSSVEKSASGITDVIQGIKDGTALSLGELHQLAYEYPDVLNAMATTQIDYSTAEGQIEMLSDIVDSYEEEYKGFIQTQIDLQNQFLAESAAAGTITPQLAREIHQQKQVLYEMLELDFDELVSEPFVWEDVLNTDDLFGNIDDVKSNAQSINDTINEIASNGALSLGDFYAVAMELPAVWEQVQLAISSGDFDLSNIESQTALLERARNSVESEYKALIRDKIVEIQAGIRTNVADGGISDEELTAANALIGALYEIMEIPFGDAVENEAAKIASGFERATDSIHGIHDSYEMIRGLETGDTTDLDMLEWFGELNEIRSEIGADPVRLDEYFDMETGEWDTDGLWQIVDATYAIEGVTGVPEEFIQSLITTAKAGDEATSSLERIENAADSVESAFDLMAELHVGDSGALETLESIIDFAENANTDVGSLINSVFGGDGYDTDVIEAIAEVQLQDMLDALSEIPGVTEQTVSRFETLIRKERDAATTAQKLESAIEGVESAASTLSSAFGVVTDLEFNDSSAIEALNSILALAQQTGADAGYLLNTTFTGAGFDTTAIRAVADTNIINTINALREIPGITEATVQHFERLIREEQEAELAAQKLSKAFDVVKDASGLIDNIDSGEADFIDMFSTATELAREAGVEITTFYSDGVWNTDAIRSFADEYIDSLENVGEVSSDIANEMRRLFEETDEVGKLRLDLDVEVQAFTDLVAIINESSSATGLTSDSISKLISRYRELSGFNLYALFDHTAAGVRINHEELRRLEGLYEETEALEYQSKLEELTSQFELLTAEMEKVDPSSIAWAEMDAERISLAEQINDVAALAAQYEGLTSAYNKWMNLRGGSEDGDMYDNIFAGLEEAYELEQAGLIGTNEFAAYTQLLTDEDLTGKNAFEIAEIFNEAYPKMKRYFTDGRKGCENFIDDLTGLNSELDTFVEYNKETGEYSINLDEDGYAKVAEELGLSKETIDAIMLKLADYGWDVNIDPAVASLELLQNKAEQASEKLNESGVTDYEFSFNTGSEERVDEQIEEIQKTIEALESGEAEVPVDSEDLEEAYEILHALLKEKQELTKPAVMKISAGGIAGNLGETIRAMQALQEAYNKLQLGVDQESLQPEIDSAIATLQEQDKELLVDIGLLDTTQSELSTDLDTLIASINAVEKEVLIKAGVDQTLFDDFVNADHEADGVVTWTNDTDAVDAFKAMLHKANGEVEWDNDTSNVKKTFKATGTVVWKNTTNSSTSTSYSPDKNNVEKMATGTAHVHGNWGTSKSGVALMGELGRELVVRDGRFFTVGDNGAGFYRYQKGDIIFNHEQTKEIFEHGKLTGAKRRGRVYMNGTAMAEGTAFANATATGKWYESTTSTGGKKTSSSESSGTFNDEDFVKFLEDLEALNAQLEHLIEHQEALYSQYERGLNFDGMKDSLIEQAALYKEMMDNAKATVDKYLMYKAPDTLAERQEAEQAYWDAQENFYNVLDELNVLFTDALDDKIDDLQGAYDDLTSAADEYNEYGFISIDTLQKLLDNGLQYATLLEYQNGQYTVNKDALDELILKEKEQLAVETALAHVNSILQALMDGDTEKVNALIDATNNISNSTWDMVYAQAALALQAGLSDEAYEKLIASIDTIRDLSSQTVSESIDAIEEERDSIDSLREDQLDSLEDILDLVMDMIEYETEEMVDAIEDQIDAYGDLIDARKELLQQSKDESDYEDEIAEKLKAIADIQAKIDMLSLDDSRSARAEEAALREELAELQKDLADTQEEKAYDSTIAALDKMQADYEAGKQSEIERLENSISSTEKLYQLALERINAGWDSLYTDIINWNTQAGSQINDEITERWNAATKAAEEYGSYLEAYRTLDWLINGERNPSIDRLIGEMGSNPETQVDEKAIKALETMTYKIVTMQEVLADKIGEFDFAASTLTDAINNLQTHGVDITPVQTNEQTVLEFSPQITVTVDGGIGSGGSNAAKIGSEIANVTIDKLKEAFERKGITSLSGSALRQ